MNNVKPRIKLWLVIIIGLMGLLLWQRQLVAEVIQNREYRTSGDDPVMYQYMAERFRLRTLAGEKLLADDWRLIHPFGVVLTTNDLGLVHLPVFLILRSLLSMHASFQLMILVNTLLAYLLMYLMLRLLKNSRGFSVEGAVAYAFMPFLGYWRISEHYVYMFLFVFPLVELTWWWWHSRKQIVIPSLVLGGLVGAVIYINFYYFYMVGLMIGIQVLLAHINWRWLGIMGLAAAVIVSPVVVGGWQHYDSLKISQSQWQGSVATYAAQPLSFVIPSPAGVMFGNRIPENLRSLQPGEGTGYWGVYTIVGLGLALWQKQHKKLLLAMAILYLLTLGNRVGTVSFYSVAAVLLPFFSQFRAPIRLTALVMFVGVIVATKAFDTLRPRIGNKVNQWFWLVTVAVVMMVDQFYVIKPGLYRDVVLPLKAYEYIHQSELPGAVLELPMVLRDGYQYRGNIHDLGFVYGALIHDRPVVGGYNSRLSDEVFTFYDRCLVTQVSRIASVDTKAIQTEAMIETFDSNVWRVAFDDLRVRFVLLAEDIGGYQPMVKLMRSLGYEEIKADEGYALFLVQSGLGTTVVDTGCKH
jgi:hypothetical protein